MHQTEKHLPPPTVLTRIAPTLKQLTPKSHPLQLLEGLLQKPVIVLFIPPVMAFKNIELINL